MMFNRRRRYTALTQDPEQKSEPTKLSYYLGGVFRQYLRRSFSSWKRALLLFFVVFLSALCLQSICLAIFFPVYNVAPAHYQALATQIKESSNPGRGNVHAEKVFVAANIINADLVRNAWGPALRELVDILGPANVYVSIYENDAGSEIGLALEELKTNLSCNVTLQTGQHIELGDLYRVKLSDNERVVKRIEYLAEVRNRALRPLQEQSVTSSQLTHQSSLPVFDKLLFLNDVYFDPIQAAQLLFSTNQDENGKADYQTACAVDFMSMINNYDDYATRDLDGKQLGYGPGFRIFPWFADGVSRADVLSGSDAVRVRSCWGGMVAFNAAWFQPKMEESEHNAVDDSDSNIVRFRAEKELLWDASECCLINADITSRYLKQHPQAQNTGIFQNPYVRTAYASRTFRHIHSVTRFEHGFSVLQYALTKLARYPLGGERRLEEEGAEVSRQEWIWEEAGIKRETVERVALPGGFCGRMGMDYMKEDFAEANARGEKSFIHLKTPYA